PFIFLSFGWLGLYSGLFIGFQDIQRFNLRVWNYAIADSLIIFFSYFLVSGSVLWFYHDNLFESLCAAVALSLAALEVSPLAVSTLRHLGRGNRSFGLLLQSLSGMSGIFTIIFLGFVSPLFLSETFIDFGFQIVFQLALAAIMGFITVYAIHDLRHSRDFLIWIIAILMITSGLAKAFHYNAIFMNMIIGIIISTFSHRRESVRRQLEPLEKPVFLLLLLFAGLNLQINWVLMLLAVALIFLRLLIKVLVFRSFYGINTETAPGVRTLAPAIIPFGNLSFTIGLYLLIMFPTEFSRFVLGALFFQYILSFTLASFAVRGGLLDKS
ncbi:cation:proton antiporter, partial [bacterium]|nr:cation:proton antiporter [bacterium]